jgi:ABC-type ATPase with predicted acetyltransferase domain
MPRHGLRKRDIAKIKAHVDAHPMSLALIRSESAPLELEAVLKPTCRECGLRLKRVFSSPNSEFGIVELNSKDRILVVLFVLGDRTELISVSETDDAYVRHLEDSIHSSNFYSEIIREGT